MSGGARYVLDDLRFAVRKLRKAPGYTGAAVLTLALAIGANTAIFSVADAVLFRPLPYADADRLQIVRMMDLETSARYTYVPYSALDAVDRYHDGVGEVAMLEGGSSLLVQGEAGAESIPVVRVTANYFGVAGVGAARGRTFAPDDEAGAGRVALLSHGFWLDELGADESVVGSTVTLGTTTLDVLGVLPAGFVFPSGFAAGPDIVTLMANPGPEADGGTFHPVVRLEPGVTPEQAQAELEAISAGLDFGDEPATLVLDSVRPTLYQAGGTIMEFMLAASMLVLLLGCANLANLLLVRGKRSELETGVRAALGADRTRLVRPLVFEALLIGLAGAVGAVAATALTFDALLRQVPPLAYGSAPVGVDGRVLSFALALGLLAALVFAAVPAWRTARADPQTSIRSRSQGTPGRGFVGRPMVAVQVALALILSTGAAVAGRASLEIAGTPLGFEPDRTVQVNVLPPADVAGVDARAFYAEAVRVLGERPDVEVAGATGSLPIADPRPWAGITSGPDSDAVIAGLVQVLPGYFEAAGIERLEGRLLDGSDLASELPVVVLEQSAAAALFPGGGALGSTFTDHLGRDVTVVGVVADVRQAAEGGAEPLVYAIPVDRLGPMHLVARVRDANAATLRDIRRSVAPLAPGRVVRAGWWSDAIAAHTAYRNPRFQSIVLVGFATLALGLTALGIFAVVAFLVATRTREVGIRLALGGTRGSIIALLLRRTLVPVAVGLAVGLLGSRWLAGLAEAQLFEVDASDPAAIGAAVVTVLVAALAAAYLPARRASRIEPVVAQRVV